MQILFSDAQNIKHILSQPSLNCRRSQCVREELYRSQSKEAQYMRGVNEVSVELTKEGHSNLLTYGMRYLWKKEEASYHWLKKSASQGFAPAMYELALLYLKDGNKELFEEWLAQAAEHNYGLTQLKLSQFFLNEYGDVYTDIDGTLFIILDVLIQEVTNEKGGYRYEQSDIEEGIKWTQRAMEQGLFLPLSYLKNLVDKEFMSEQDYRFYIKDFSERGHPEAQLIWARHLLAQDQNTDKAMELLLELAEKSSSFALEDLSRIHEQGLHGIKKNLKKAKEFKQKAVKFSDFSDKVRSDFNRGFTQSVSVLNSTSQTTNTCEQEFEDRT